MHVSKHSCIICIFFFPCRLSNWQSKYSVVTFFCSLRWISIFHVFVVVCSFMIWFWYCIKRIGVHVIFFLAYSQNVLPFQDKTKLYIFLELATEGSLLNLYQEHKLSDSQASKYTRQIVKGLKYLHEHNVVHRWFKWSYYYIFWLYCLCFICLYLALSTCHYCLKHVLIISIICLCYQENCICIN